MRLTLVATGLVFTFATACTGNAVVNGLLPDVDTADVSDLGAVEDIVDAPADSGTVDVLSPGDVFDALSASDSSDALSATDTTDAVNVSDALDVSDAVNVGDAIDVSDALDVSDAVDVSDTVDVGPPRCTRDADCAAEPEGRRTCDVASGRCVACSPAADRCRPEQHCDPGMFVCVDGCRSDEGCSGATPRCDVMAHRCVGCVRDDHCPTRANSAPRCRMATCAFECAPGFGDCNGDPADGCEARLDSLMHCGRCGTSCSASRGTPVCRMGACAIERCDTGFGDCDGMAANGCETDTTTTLAHCGACGMRCTGAGQSCQMGRCVDDCRATMTTACGAGTVCDFLSGRCLDPSMACVLTGMPEACGEGTTMQRCGPGSRCNATSRVCEAAPVCRRVVCDATGLCRGADCTLPSGGVSGLTLGMPSVGAAGTRNGLRVDARVMAEGLCGLNVSFDLRRDGGYYVSAGGDRAIWRVTPEGMRTRYVSASATPSGVTADRSGALYYVLTHTGAIRRVREVAGSPVDELFAMITPPAGAARGISRLTFGPDGQLYVANLNTVVRIDAMGRTSNVITVPGLLQNTITGLVFDNDGALIMASIVPDVYRLAPGATAATRFYSVMSVNPGDFFHEALVLGPDGLIYGSSFPTTPTMGLIYRLDTTNTPRYILGLTEMQRDVPTTRYAGVHGMAFGVDGSLYFVNQNTPGNTGEAVGQLLVRRPSGRIELIAAGFNFDWPDGFDGDLVIAQITVANVSAPVRAGGTAQAVFDVPTTPGTYEIRALVTDPRGGAIHEARVPVTVR